MRAAGAGAGLAGRRAPAPRCAPAPRAPLLYALRREPGAVCLRARAQRDIQQLSGVRAASPDGRRQRREQRASRLRRVHERRRRRRRHVAAAGRAAAQLGGRHPPRIREAWQGGSQRMDSRT